MEGGARRGGGARVNPADGWPGGRGRNRPTPPAYDVAKAAVIRLTTTLGWLREREGIRVNCLVPDWVATQEGKSYVDALTPQQRKEGNVPDVLLTTDQIADAVVQLATDESLARRGMVW